MRNSKFYSKFLYVHLLQQTVVLFHHLPVNVVTLICMICCSAVRDVQWYMQQSEHVIRDIFARHSAHNYRHFMNACVDNIQPVIFHVSLHPKIC